MSNTRSIVQASVGMLALGLAGWGGHAVTRPAYDGNAGIMYGTAYAPVRDRNIDFNIWYPAEPGGAAVTVGGNGVFYGSPAGRGAPHQSGHFPVIIISHGAGGNAGQFGWIASTLAATGYVVILPNHPGTTSGDADAEAAVRVWERPADVSAVLDELSAHPDDYPFIDQDRVAVLGLSAGGYTALALSGARIDPIKLQNFCDGTDHGMSDCSFLAHFGVDLHTLDLSPAARDLGDPRIRAAVVIDPGIVSTLTEASLSQIEIPMFIINLGNEELVPEGVYARSAAETIPEATYAIVPDANHFSFLAECKAMGAAILKDEGETDPLCDDAGGRSRAEIHREVANEIIAYLNQTL